MGHLRAVFEDTPLPGLSRYERDNYADDSHYNGNDAEPPS